MGEGGCRKTLGGSYMLNQGIDRQVSVRQRTCIHKWTRNSSVLCYIPTSVGKKCRMVSIVLLTCQCIDSYIPIKREYMTTLVEIVYIQVI